MEYLLTYEDYLGEDEFDWKDLKHINHIDQSDLVLYEIHLPTYNPSCMLLLFLSPLQPPPLCTTPLQRDWSTWLIRESTPSS